MNNTAKAFAKNLKNLRFKIKSNDFLSFEGKLSELSKLNKACNSVATQMLYNGDLDDTDKFLRACGLNA